MDFKIKIKYTKKNKWNYKKKIFNRIHSEFVLILLKA